MRASAARYVVMSFVNIGEHVVAIHDLDVEITSER